MYSIGFTENALLGMAKLKKSEPQRYKKLESLIEELKVHPTTGTGKPEQLKGTSEPTWSRRISEKHRLVYKIEEEKVVVFVLSAYGHYDDK